MKKRVITLFFLCSLITSCANRQLEPEGTVDIPIQGNSYTTSGGRDIISSRNGAVNKNASWDQETTVSTFFRVSKDGDLVVSLNYSSDADAKMKVTIAQKTFTVNCPQGEEKSVFIGKIKKIKQGYVRVDFSDIQKTGASFPELTSLTVSGGAVKDTLFFVNNPEFYYWGRRGPSVHINYTLPEGDVEWFYNEVTVPEGFDPVGSYFMACGFAEGYFGFQVNSERERRILFSVWSPFQTDNPGEIPEDERILLNRKNEKTSSQSFGGEGSGGQNYMIYNWRAGVTYKFLLQCRPDPARANFTEYTAYFHTPEDGWMLIASNSRPKIVTYYKRPHSFLENFNPQTGHITRKVYFDNQWAYVVGTGWQEMTKCHFTYDNTARQKQRMDFKGGVENNMFFLQNCGFFSDYTDYQTPFERSAKGKMPEIDFEKLP